MRRIETKWRGYEAIIEEYDSFRELIEKNHTRRRNFGERDKGGEWYGVESVKEAEEMLLYGWEDKDKINRIMDAVKKMDKMQEVSKLSFKNDIVGFAPIVPNAIIGIPQNMINCTRKPKKAKVINIVLDATYSCGNGADKVLNWGAELIGKIVGLEKQGWRVRLDYVSTFVPDDGDGQFHAVKAKLKDERQPFDIKRMMFSIAHAAMLRCIAFEWYERLPGAKRHGGHGVAIQNWDRNQQEAIDFLADTESSYYIPVLGDYEEILKNIK